MRKFSLCKICVTFLSIYIISGLPGFSQTPLTHEKKVFQDEDKKLYWNKQLPVYIRLSTSPDEQVPNHLLKSDTSAKYVDPYYLDTEGKNFIRSKWAVNKTTKKYVEPKIEVLWEVYADGLAPISKLKYVNDKELKLNGQLFCGKNIEIDLSARDAVSGIDKIYYSTNGSEYQEYKYPVKFSTEGQYTFNYYALDKVGNAEQVKGEKFIIDAGEPTTEHLLTGDFMESTVSGRAKISLIAKDEQSGLSKTFVILDKGKEKTYTTPIEMAQLSEGEHSISYYSVDNVNNREETKEFLFYVDKSAPLVTSDVQGDKHTSHGKDYFSGRAKIKLIAVDNKAGVKDIFYSINGSGFKLYDSPFYLTGNGNTKVDYYAIDKIGNKSALQINKNERALNSYVDLSGPALSHHYIGSIFKTRDTVFINAGTKLQLKGNDAEAGIQKITYSINGSEEKEYTEALTFDKEGHYTIEYVGYDNVNNSNKQSIYFVVDTSGPSIFSTFDGKSLSNKTLDGNPCEVYPSHVALFLSVTDKQLGYDKILFSINGGPETLYTNPINGFGRGKDYKIKVRALDKLGNVSSDQVLFAIAQ